MNQIRKGIGKYGRHAVIIGGGILGLDVAYGLLKCGLQVTVLEKEKRLMPLQADEFAPDSTRMRFAVRDAVL